MTADIRWYGLYSEGPIAVGDRVTVSRVIGNGEISPQIPFEYVEARGMIIPVALGEHFDVESIAIDGREQLQLVRASVANEVIGVCGQAFAPANVLDVELARLPYGSTLTVRVRRHGRTDADARAFRMAINGTAHYTEEQEAWRETLSKIIGIAEHDMRCQAVDVSPQLTKGWICHFCQHWNVLDAKTCVVCDHACCIGIGAKRVTDREVTLEVSSEVVAPKTIAAFVVRLSDHDMPAFAPRKVLFSPETAPKFALYAFLCDHLNQLSSSCALPCEAFNGRNVSCVNFDPITREMQLFIENISEEPAMLVMQIEGMTMVVKDAVDAQKESAKKSARVI